MPEVDLEHHSLEVVVGHRSLKEEVVGHRSLEEEVGHCSLEEVVGHCSLEEEVGHRSLEEAAGHCSLKEAVGHHSLEEEVKHHSLEEVVEEDQVLCQEVSVVQEERGQCYQKKVSDRKMVQVVEEEELPSLPCQGVASGKQVVQVAGYSTCEEEVLVEETQDLEQPPFQEEASEEEILPVNQYYWIF